MTPRQVQILLITLAIAIALVAVSWFEKKQQPVAIPPTKKTVIESQILLKSLATVEFSKALSTKDITLSELPIELQVLIPAGVTAVATQQVFEEGSKAGFTIVYTTASDVYDAMTIVSKKFKTYNFIILQGRRIDFVGLIEAESSKFRVQAIISQLDDSYSRVVFRITPQ